MIKYFLEKENTEDDLCSFFSALCKGKPAGLPAGVLRAAGQKAKMEAGANPARSRHCIDGALLLNPLNRRVWEGKRGDEV